MKSDKTFDLATNKIIGVPPDTAVREEPRPVPIEEEPRPVAIEEQPHPVQETYVPLFVEGDAAGYRTRWSAIQTGFVDEPRKAVEEADTLVNEVMQRLTTVFTEERKRLEGEWDRKDSVSTEDLRQAMQRYRSFFERLLSL